ncbi:hypothetical protein C7999DRAFT_16125 [Corynascus novoguineensis]|uniref:Ap4A phosphorylase II n=1 Tax=Corynascus novoguineensis TaxID=1126955 RepID=A0AAN7HDD0_9PEZI|nr:hypothetical protein C7999DRAFT_16125 [Corynascus novoguineensis]
MDAQLNEGHLLAHFDRLVQQGMVVYDANYRTVVQSDRGFSFEFRVLSGIAAKPQTTRDAKDQPSSRPSGCRPGGDITVSGYELATIGTTHLLMANKFPSARPHYLILTQDGFRRQHEALDMDDMTAARHVLSSLSRCRRHLVIFNCGIDGGCSRMHKHMQVFPAPASEFPLWPDNVAEEPKLPFKAFMRRFRNGVLPEPRELLDIYRALLRRAERAVGHAALEGEAAVPHNVILDRNWLVVVPRLSGAWDGLSTNAAGMLGMVWISSEDKLDVWLERGPANVLAQVGVPADAS